MTSQDRVPLITYLAGNDARQLVEKGLFGGQFVRLSSLLTLGPWLFHKGAVLGRARADRLELLAKMLAQPGKERSVCDFLHQTAHDSLKVYGKEPDSLIDVWFKTTLPKGIDLFNRRAVNQKVPMEKVVEWTSEWVLRGIAFGGTFPEATERAWRRSMETVDKQAWTQARQAGLDILEEFTPMPLEEMEQQVLLEAAYYASEYFPELVEPLGLRVA